MASTDVSEVQLVKLYCSICNQCCNTSKITDALCTSTDPKQILVHWSNKICEDFKLRNGLDIPTDQNDAMKALTCPVDSLRQQLASIQELMFNVVQTVHGIPQEKASNEDKLGQILSAVTSFQLS